MKSDYSGSLQLFPGQALIRLSMVITYAASSIGNKMAMDLV